MVKMVNYVNQPSVNFLLHKVRVNIDIKTSHIKKLRSVEVRST